MKRHPQISQFLTALALTAFAFASGCTCSGDIEVQGDPAIAFVSPVDGAMFNEVDADGNVSLAVTVSAVGDVGNVTLSTVGTDGSDMVASASGGLITFSNYTLGSGQHTLRARAESEDASAACTGALCAEVTVTVLGSGCVVVSPATGSTVTADKYPNADGDTGYDPIEIDFSATCVGVTDDSDVTLSINGGEAFSSSVSANIASFFQVAVQEGENTATISTGDISYSTTFTVNTGGCSATIGLNPQPAAGNQVSAADDISNDSGLQYGFSVATDCGASSTYRLQWARVGSTEYTNVTGSGATGTLGGDGADGSYTISGTGIVLPESISPNDINLVAQVTSQDGTRSGWSTASAFWFDSVVPDIAALSDNDLGITECFQAGSSTLSGVVTDEPGGQLWIRVYDREAGDTACDPEVATSCDSNATAGDACVTANGESFCRVAATIDAQGAFSASGFDVPAGAVAVEYVPVDALGNIGSAYIINRDVLASEVGPNSPVAAVLQVGTQVLNEVVTAGDGSKSFNSTISEDVVLNLGDRSGDSGFDVDVVVGTLNVPTGSVGTVSVGGVAAGTFTIQDAGGNSFAESSTTYSVSLANTDGVTANAISVTFAAAQGSGTGGLNCLVDALATSASVLADASQPQLTSAGLLIADASCNTPAVGEDGTDGVALVLGGVLAAGTEAGTTVTASIGTCTDTCGVGTCVNGACQISTTVTGADSAEPAFTFGSVEVPAGAAPDYSVAITYEAVDPNGNTSGAVATTIQVVPVVPDFSAGFGFQQPANGEFLTRDVDDSVLDAGLQYVVTVTGTPGAVYAAGETVSLSGSAGVTIPTDVTEGTDVWSWAVTVADGQQTITTTATDFCNTPRSITHTVVAYTDRPDMSLGLSFSDAASTFDESSSGAVTGGRQMVMSVNTGEAPAAIQALTSDFTRKVRYTVYLGTKNGSSCTGDEVARNTLTPAEVGSATAGKVFEAIDLGADISALGLVDGDGAAVNNLLGQSVCVAVTSHDTYQGTEANEQTASVAFTQRNVAPPIVSILGANGVAIADGAELTIDDDIDNDLGNGFSLNLSPALEAADSADGTVTLVVDATGTGFDSTSSQSLAAGNTSTVFGPVALAPGSANLTARFTDAYGNVSDDFSINVTVPQGDGPSLEITYPVNGSSLGSDDLDRVNIGLLAGSPVTPTSCDVSIGGVLVADDTPWSSGDSLQVDLAASDYADGALEVSVTCVAASGASATLPISVNIDDTMPSAPILSQTVWTDGSGTTSVTIPYSSTPSYVNCSFIDTVENPLGECTRSLQHAVTMRVDPNATGETLSNIGLVLTATYGGDGSTKTFTVDSLAGTSVTSSDGTTFASALVIAAAAGRYDVTILNVDFGNADQDVTFDAKLVDAAGNESPSDVETITVDRTAPSFTQNSPTYEAPPSTVVLRQVEDAVFATTTQLDLDFQYTAEGLEAGATVTMTLTNSTESFSDLRDNVQINGSSYTGVEPFTVTTTVNSNGQANFPRLNFSEAYSILDGFTATVSAVDASGNNSDPFTYNFYTLIQAPVISAVGDSLGGSFVANDDGNQGLAGLQKDLIYGATALGTGAVITLCSTASAGDGGGTVPCRWGFPSSASEPGSGVNEAPGSNPALIKGDSTDNTLMRGFVIGTMVSATGSGFTFNLQTLPEGEQWIHAEVGESGAVVNTASDFYRFTVDSVVPVISAIDLTANDTNNDLGDGTVRLSAGLNEVTGTTGNYEASVRVRVDFASDLDGQTVTVSNGGNTATGTLSQVGDALEAVVSIAVAEGSNEVTASVSDTSGNAAASSPELSFEVDTAGPSTLTLAVPSPTSGTVFSGTDFPAVASLLSADPQDQAAIQAVTTAVLDDAIVVNFAGETAVVGSKATVQLFDADGSSNPSELYESEVVVSDSATQIIFSAAGGGGPAVPLRQGLEQLQVVFTDGVGNTVTMNQELLSVDFKPAELGMSLTAGGSDITSSCASDATSAACVADLKDFGGGAYQNGNKQCAFDTTAGNGCPANLIAELGADACNDVGTDIQFTLLGCSNSDDSLEGNSGAGSCNVAMALQSRTSGGLWANVDSGTLTKTSDEALSVSYLAALAGDALINPAIVREFRLQATDPNGNVSRSASVFVKINNPGTTLDGYILTPVTNARVDLVSDLAISSSLVDSSTVDMDFVVTPTAGGDTPVGVQIVTNGATADAVREDGNQLVETVDPGSGTTYYTATFTDFTIPTVADSSEAGFALAVTILCDSGGSTVACGTTTYSGLKADTIAPTFQFERCSLLGLNVPMDTTLNDVSCTGETNTQTVGANITQAGLASWNVALDAGASNDGVFSFDATSALKLDLYGLAANVDVTLAVTDENSGAAVSVTNATATSSGCTAGATSCSVTFTNLTITELDDGSVILITPTFSDAAGNAATPKDPRTVASERIRVTIDATPPADVTPTVCIGGSTTPASVGTPSADPSTFEDAACSTHCSAGGSCSRQAGQAVIAFNASGDDGSTGEASSYNVKVAALEIPYDGSTQYSACSELTASSVTESDSTLNGNSGLSIGAVSVVDGTSYVAVNGLLPHRSYCFAVEALDNAGNASSIAGNQAEREFFFVNGAGADDMNPANPVVAGGQTYIDYSGSDDMTNGLKTLDFDGDNVSDVALVRLGEVLLYLSTLEGTADYPISILAPAGSGGYFGYPSSGDFDNDGFDDLVISDAGASASDGSGFGGAVYLYFGRNDSASGAPWWNEAAPNVNHPSIKADAVLIGATFSFTGQSNGLANVDGVAGDELLFDVPFGPGGIPALYGITGGDRARFTADTLDIVASGAGAGEIAPDLAITGYADGTSQGFFFGGQSKAADIDGDGVDDLVFSDSFIEHSPTEYPEAKGEVYVFKGGATLLGTHSLSSSTSLMHTLRAGILDGKIGNKVEVIRQPRAGDSADWLAVNCEGVRDVLIFKATSNPSGDPAVTAGIVPASYTTGEIAGISYNSLDQTDWTGSTTGTRYGLEMTQVDFGVNYLVVSSGTGTAATFLYSYDAASDNMVKKAVIPGNGSEGNALKVQGATVGGAGNLIMLNKIGYDSIRVQ